MASPPSRRPRSAARLARLATAAGAGVAFLATSHAVAAVSNWNIPGSGNWSVASNWSPFLPNGTDLDANFGGAITGPATVTQNVAGLTLGGIDFDNANSYTIAGASGIAFDVSGSPGPPSPIIDVLQGTHTIAVPLTLDTSRLFVAGRGGPGLVNNAAATLTLSGIIDGSTTGFTKTGASTLVMTGSTSNTFTGPTIVEQGTLRLAKTGGTAVAIPSESITIGTGTSGATSATAVLAQPDALGAGVRVIVNGTGQLDTGAFFPHLNGAPTAITLTGGKIVNAGFYLDGNVVTFASPQPATIDGFAINLTATRTFFVNDGAAAEDLVISAPIEGAGNLIKVNLGTMRLAAANTYGGVTTAAGGTLILNHSLTTSSQVNVTGFGVRLELTSDGTANKVIKTGPINVQSGGRLDLRDNKLITTVPPGAVISNTTTYDGIQGMVQQAHHGGTWDSPGLTTSMPDALTGLTTLAVSTGTIAMGLEGGQTATFAGQTVTAADTLIMYTYAGDANLDGFLSGDDYSAIDFAIAISDSSCWWNGDFNYDGIISGDDYSAIDFNIVAQGTPFPTGAPANSIVVVPEPAGTAVCALAATAALRRRRSRLRAE